MRSIALAASHTLSVPTVLLSLAILSTGQPAAAERTTWLTGTQFERRLGEPLSLEWSGVELRPALEKLAELHRVAVVIDRRVDPGQELTLSFTETPLGDVLARVAEDRALGLSLFGPVAYFGPLDTAARLRTVAALRKQDVDRLPASRREALLKRRAWGWNDLDTPRDLVAQLADEAKVEIAGLDQVPHDLWAGADLPALTIVERLSLVLAQFNATFEPAEDGAHLAIVPVPEDVAIGRTFAGGGEAQKLADEWRTLLPECRIELAGNRIVVRGRVEDLERIDVSRQGERTRTTVAGPKEKTYTLTVKNQPLGTLLRLLAPKMNIDIRVDEAAVAEAGISLDQKVSFAVKEATFDDLFKTILQPAGLAYRRKDQTVEVFPAEKP